MEEGDTVHVML